MISQDQTLGSGHRWLLGAERPGYRTTLAATIEGNSAGFRSLGEDLATLPPRLQFAGQASYSADWGRVGLAVALQRAYDRVNIATYSLNYSTTILDNWQVNAFFTRAFGSGGGYTVGTMLTVPIDRRTISSTSLQKQASGSEFYTSATHTPEGTTGWAWRAQATRNEQARVEGGAYYLSPHGLFSGELSAQRNQSDLRLGATGGLLWTDGRLFATQHFDTSAALVTVEGFPGVGVGLGATRSEKTDQDGVALVSRLGAYQKNPIRLDPNDLPISAEIDSIEQDAVPPWRSVTKIDFPVRGGRAALIQVLLDDGQPAPAGSIVRIEGDDRPFYMARRGEVYVTGLKAAKARLQLQWQQGSCKLDVDLPPGTPDDISRVGPLRCSGVAR
jgi:outer membrane usher protein